MNINKIIKYITIIILVIFIVILGLNLEQYLNQKRINKYINDNNYKLEKYNIYTLTKNENNTETVYQLLYDNYFFTKYIITTIGDNSIKIKYYYTTNKEIIIEYEDTFITANEFKMNSKTATFKDNKLIKCNINIGNNKDCTELNNYAINYTNEINNILKQYNINTRFLQIKNKTN